MAKQLLNAAEAAEYLALSKRTLEKWRTSLKGPPYVKMNGAVRYRLEDLEQWVADQVTAATA